jgi:phospholipid N-methyltransferase
MLDTTSKMEGDRMTAIYQLKTYELTEDFFKMLRDTFQGKEITITVKAPHDETAYLLSNEANRKHLLAGVEAVKQGKFVHTMTLEEAEALAQ